MTSKQKQEFIRKTLNAPYSATVWTPRQIMQTTPENVRKQIERRAIRNEQRWDRKDENSL